MVKEDITLGDTPAEFQIILVQNWLDELERLVPLV